MPKYIQSDFYAWRILFWTPLAIEVVLIAVGHFGGWYKGIIINIMLPIVALTAGSCLVLEGVIGWKTGEFTARGGGVYKQPSMFYWLNLLLFIAGGIYALGCGVYLIYKLVLK